MCLPGRFLCLCALDVKTEGPLRPESPSSLAVLASVFGLTLPVVLHCAESFLTALSALRGGLKGKGALRWSGRTDLVLGEQPSGTVLVSLQGSRARG